MKAEELKKLYALTPEMHESVAHALRKLDSKSPERYRKQKNIKRFAVVFAVVVLLTAFSTVAYATNLFGLLTEPVGKYGIDMRIAEGETTASTVSKRYAKPNPTYLPKGCRQLIGNDDNENPIRRPTIPTAITNIRTAMKHGYISMCIKRNHTARKPVIL